MTEEVASLHDLGAVSRGGAVQLGRRHFATRGHSAARRRGELRAQARRPFSYCFPRQALRRAQRICPARTFVKRASAATSYGSRELPVGAQLRDRKSTRLNSSHRCISYAVFCLKKK